VYPTGPLFAALAEHILANLEAIEKVTMFFLPAAATLSTGVQ
jgi:hypothetical protein